MLKNITSAYYIPSKYTIFSYSSTTIRENIDFDDPTLFHEYLHFIQDITLPYLIRQSSFSSLERCYFSESAVADQQITVPFYKWPKDYHILSQQYDFTWGEQQAIKKFGTIINHYKVSEDSINEIQVHKYILDSSNGKKCTLSAKDFIEFITRKIENKRWPEKNYYDIPYKVVDLVLDYLGFGELSDSTKILLIEFCLYNDNPVNQLFIISENNKESIISADNHNSAYDFFKSYIWVSKGGFIENVLSKLLRRKNSHLDYFFECYKDDEFLPIREWLYHVINYNFKNKDNIFIFHFLFQLDPMSLKFKIEDYFINIGIPILINENGEHVSAVPEKFRSNNFIFLYVESLLIQSLKDGDRMCPLLKYKMCNGIKSHDIWCRNDFLNVIALNNPCLITKTLAQMNLSNLPIIRFNNVNFYNAAQN